MAGISKVKGSGLATGAATASLVGIDDNATSTKLTVADTGIDVTGNVVVSGTVDGRDVATDGTKLDTIETSATADQTAGEIEAAVSHDNLLGFVANEHIDWSLTNVANIHADNYTDNDTVYTHPTTAGNIHLPTGGTVGQVVVNTASGTGTWQAAPGFVTGTKMVFAQAAAPTGWTQDVTNNDKALRVVSSTTSGGSAGGTHAFSTPPSTAHTHTGPSHTHSTPIHGHAHTLSAGATTLTIAQMPSHGHTFRYTANWNTESSGYPQASQSHTTNNELSNTNSVSTAGGGGSHDHALAGSITDAAAGTSGAGGTGATGSAGPTAFAPQYVDVIVATKD